MKTEKKICSVKGCDDNARAGGLCWRHYQRLRRNGATGDAAQRRSPVGERLTRLQIHMKPEHLKMIRKSAKAAGQSIGEWLRRRLAKVLDAEARKARPR